MDCVFGCDNVFWHMCIRYGGGGGQVILRGIWKMFIIKMGVLQNFYQRTRGVQGKEIFFIKGCSFLGDWKGGPWKNPDMPNKKIKKVQKLSLPSSIPANWCQGGLVQKGRDRYRLITNTLGGGGGEVMFVFLWIYRVWILTTLHDQHILLWELG